MNRECLDASITQRRPLVLRRQKRKLRQHLDFVAQDFSYRLASIRACLFVRNGARSVREPAVLEQPHRSRLEFASAVSAVESGHGPNCSAVRSQNSIASTLALIRFETIEA